jgi:Fe-Mn family superoxide dismutase
MEHQLMALPFAYNALEPYMSEETLQYHHNKHHLGYVNKLNELIKNTKFSEMHLVNIIKRADGPIFNNAAQVFNHDFFWNGLSPDETSPSVELRETIERHFNAMDAFKEAFMDAGMSLFGSGWVWLSIDADGRMQIEKTGNADNPINHGRIPLLACDVWEHAYYIDYRNARPDYLQRWWEKVNWRFVSDNLAEYQEKHRYYFIHECNENSTVCDYMNDLEDAEKTNT